MCKLSLNIVPDVYNGVQSSFLSLAWPWSGRSLPKGNQWEWWDPGQGPLPGLGEVSHSWKGTIGSAGTLEWGPMWSGSQSICHPQCTPDTPFTSWCPLTVLNGPTPPRSPNAPYATYTLFGPRVITLTASPQYMPDIPYTSLHPLTPLTAPMPLHPLGAPNAPLFHLYPIWIRVPTLPASLQYMPTPSDAPWHHLTAPDTLLTALDVPYIP